MLFLQWHVEPLTVFLTFFDVAQTLRRRFSCRHEHPLAVYQCCMNTAPTFIISPRTSPLQNQWFLGRSAAVHPRSSQLLQCCFSVASVLLQFCLRVNFCIDLSCLLSRTYEVLLLSRGGECEALGITRLKASRQRLKAVRRHTEASMTKRRGAVARKVAFLEMCKTLE